MRVPSAKLTASGLEHDRLFCVIDVDGEVVAAREAISKRKLPALATVSVAFVTDDDDAPAIELSAEGMAAPCRVPLGAAAYESESEVTVECSGRSTTAADGGAAHCCGGEMRGGSQRVKASPTPEATAFLAECAKLGTSEAAVETAEKKGFDTGLTVQHPLVVDCRLPVYIANFVLMEYGTGAIFGCPAHDQRDLDFANAYGLGVIPVVLPDDTDAASFEITDTAYTGPGKLFNSGPWDGMDVEEGKRAAIAALEAAESGTGQTTYRLRDWGVSRQRYWGCPIPVIHCDSCGLVPVPEVDLPVELIDLLISTILSRLIMIHPFHQLLHIDLTILTANRLKHSQCDTSYMLLV